MASFERPMCVLVTGANRGLGKTICLSAACKLQPESVLILMGRSEDGLKSTQEEILKLNSSITVYVYAQFECANLNCESLTTYLTGLRLPESLNDLLIVHNAGTVGDPSQSCLSLGLQTASEYMTLNFASAVAANSVFLDVYKYLSNKTVVNISSLCGVMATKSLSLYCAAKAARDMLFKVMALENPQIRILNYAPGPLNTDMFNCIRDTTYDGEIKSMFEGMTALECKTSSDKLVEILLQDKYKSGDHLDYLDELPK